MKHFYLFAFIITAMAAHGQQPPLTTFTIAEKDLIPEGITYDPAEKVFYVSSIHKRKIVRVKENGETSDFVASGQDSILQVLGMTVDSRGRLWACNNSPEHDTLNRIANIHLYDLKSKKLVRKYTVRDGKRHLFNDVYINAKDEAFITDSETGALYHIGADQKLEEFIKPGTFRYPNGITASADERKLFVSSAGMGIVSIDTETKGIAPLRHDKYFIVATDGLYRYKNSLVGVQNVIYPEAIVKFAINEDATKIDDIDFLISDQPVFDIPTTGVVVGDDFYFIANSQLLQIIGNKGRIKNPEKLTPTTIMKIKLN